MQQARYISAQDPIKLTFFVNDLHVICDGSDNRHEAARKIVSKGLSFISTKFQVIVTVLI